VTNVYGMVLSLSKIESVRLTREKTVPQKDWFRSG